jgi:competence protein ComEA
MERAPVDWGTLEERLVEPAEPIAGPSPRSLASARPAAWVLLCGLVALTVIAAGALLMSAAPEGAASLPGPASPGSAASVAADPALLVVDIEGAVRRPGLYRLAAGSRVADAIAAAGGYAADVDAAAARAALNLADPLQDGLKVLVPTRGQATPPVVASAGGTSRIDLNRATQAELEALPGIGPATAAKIIASRQQRPFQRIDELRSRKLVGASVYEQVQDLVTIGG